MRILVTGLMLGFALFLSGCATSGTSETPMAAADSFQVGTPQQEYIYRSPPPAAVRAYGLGG